MKTYIIRAGVQCFRLMLSLFIAWLVSVPLIQAAAAERGYAGAYGGEWCLIIGAFVVTYCLSARMSRTSPDDQQNQ